MQVERKGGMLWTYVVVIGWNWERSQLVHIGVGVADKKLIH
jgi:hypothetical protein